MMKYLSLVLLIALSCGCQSDQKDQSVHKKNTANKAWVGEWARQDRMNEATLNIEQIVNDTAYFFMVASSGGHTGDIEGHVALHANRGLFFEGLGEDNCTIDFELSGDTLITVTQKEGNCFTGVGVTYTGKYKNNKYFKKVLKEKVDLVTLSVLTTYHQDSIFRKLTGSDYDAFVNSTQLTSEDDDIDDLHARVVSSGVRGMYTYMENIVMIDSTDNIWAAVINDEKILYFTNRADFANTLPKTIVQWKKNFNNYEVVYNWKEIKE